MNEYTLSQAMTDIPDDWLTDAPQAKRRHRVYAKLLRVAACFAVMVGLLLVDFRGGDGIVTRPGLLTITVSAADSEIVTFSPDSVKFQAFYSSTLGISSYPYTNPITLHVSDDDGEWEDIHFRISCDYGTIHCPDIGTMLAIGEPITVPNGTVIYWDYYGWDHVATEEELSNATLDNLYMTDDRIAYVNILIFSADNIVGYAILRMNTTTVEEYAEYAGKAVVHDESWWDGKYDPDTTVYCPGGDHIVRSRYKVELLESVCFPKVDGVYQKISEQYVSNRIAACKER